VACCPTRKDVTVSLCLFARINKKYDFKDREPQSSFFFTYFKSKVTSSAVVGTLTFSEEHALKYYILFIYLFIYGLFKYAVYISDSIAANGDVMNERLTGKDVKGTGRDLIQVLSRNPIGGAEESHEKPETG
jgi:hypothetical protein